MDISDYEDGNTTAGIYAQQVKKNKQLKYESSSEIQITNMVMANVLSNDKFISHSFMKKIGNPLFIKYEIGGKYGNHNDNPVMANNEGMFRCDIAMTLFLSEPEEYEGGELCTSGCEYKLPAGSMLLYPANTVHEVKEVTKGCRQVMVTWCQSLIRDAEHRQILVDLNASREGSSFEKINSVYNKLVRMWADV